MLTLPMIITPNDPERGGRAASDILKNVKQGDYERVVEKALLSGEVPTWMTTFDDIQIDFCDQKTFKSRRLIARMLKDYLTIGNDVDNLRVPLSPITAQRVADAWGCILPTTKMVNMAWFYTFQRIAPRPWGPPYDHGVMSSLTRIREHDDIINTLMKNEGFVRTRRCAGHKKDVVMTNALRVKSSQVAIYGWHQLNARVIQTLFLGHSNTYYDYSHGIRLWSRECILDDNIDDLTRLLQDPELCRILTDEGKMIILRQP